MQWQTIRLWLLYPRAPRTGGDKPTIWATLARKVVASSVLFWYLGWTKGHFTILNCHQTKAFLSWKCIKYKTFLCLTGLSFSFMHRRVEIPNSLRACALNKSAPHFEGMLDYLYAMHTYWMNCPVDWQGLYRSKEKKEWWIIIFCLACCILLCWHIEWLDLSSFLRSFSIVILNERGICFLSHTHCWIWRVQSLNYVDISLLFYLNSVCRSGGFVFIKTCCKPWRCGQEVIVFDGCVVVVS